MPATNHTIVHVTGAPPLEELKHVRGGFSHCSRRRCPQAPAYIVAMDVVRWGYSHTQTHWLCPAHAQTWCDSHAVDIATVPEQPYAAPQD
jgi:hypothetical protein